MKYCQGPKCHEYRTKDRIRGPKGDKHYETRRRSSFYYLDGNFCDQCDVCMIGLISLVNHALDHFGRIHEPKRVGCDSAWYKDYKYNYVRDRLRDTNTYYFINDLLGQRIPITKQQYDDTDLVRPN